MQAITRTDHLMPLFIYPGKPLHRQQPLFFIYWFIYFLSQRSECAQFHVWSSVNQNFAKNSSCFLLYTSVIVFSLHLMFTRHCKQVMRVFVVVYSMQVGSVLFPIISRLYNCITINNIFFLQLNPLMPMQKTRCFYFLIHYICFVFLTTAFTFRLIC